MRLLPLLEMYEAIDFDAYAAPPRLPCTETLCLDANGMEEESANNFMKISYIALFQGNRLVDSD